jgi:hypothetical protein
MTGAGSKASRVGSEEIVIKAHANLQGVEDAGRILQGSSLGDSPAPSQAATRTQ